MIHALILAMVLMASPGTSPILTSEFDRSGGTRTGSYDEAIEMCRQLDRASSRVRFESFGSSGEDRALPVLIVDADGHHDPARVRRDGKLVVMIQAGIHAGEIDGKDAGFRLMQEIAIDGSRRDLLDHATIVFIPILNVDGHERSSPYNRAKQNGPENMGFRTNATNLNLNRDYLKADTPEIRAWLALFNRWQPDLFIDCHVTDGADYQYVVTYAIETLQSADTEVSEWIRTRLEPGLEARMAAAGYPLAPYCLFRVWHDPGSGLQKLVAPPRFSTGYAALRNRVAILIETHMLKDYATRVRGTHRMLIETLEIANQEARVLRDAVTRADALVSGETFRRVPLPLDWAASFEESTMIDFLGYAYSVEKSSVTGGDWYRYSKEPVTVGVAYFDRPRVTAEARLPEAYVVPPQWVVAIQRVSDHGLASFILREPVTTQVSTVRFRDVTWAATPYEGHHPLEYKFDEVLEERTLAPGTVIIDLAQPGARVAAHLFEPAGPDALVRWDYFDASFEQKEYIESYVIEEMAHDMLARDAALVREFEEMKQDSTFAGNPDRIRDWFYRRTPYFDTRQNLYPVGRILDRDTVERLRRMSR